MKLINAKGYTWKEGEFTVRLNIPSTADHTAIVAPEDGIWYDELTDSVWIYKESVWTELAGGGGGGSVAEPSTQIVIGTGAGVDSSADFTWNDTTKTLYINGAMVHNVTNVPDANYTILADDYFLELEEASGTRILTLPTPTEGRTLIIRNQFGVAWSFNTSVVDEEGVSTTDVPQNAECKLIYNSGWKLSVKAEATGGGGGTTYTSSNGIDIVSDDIQLGSSTSVGKPLTQDKYINTTPDYSLIINGDVPVSTAAGTLKVQNADVLGIGIHAEGGLRAIQAESDDGIGVYGVCNGSGSPFLGYTTNGIGIDITAVNGIAASFATQPSTANDVTPVVHIVRGATTAGSNGIGGAIDFYVNTSASSKLSNRIISKWTDATDVSRKSTFQIVAVHNGVEQVVASFDGDGSINLPEYGSGTHTGTTAKILGVTSSGDVIDVDPASLGGGGGSEDLDATMLIGNITHHDYVFKNGDEELLATITESNASGRISLYNSDTSSLRVDIVGETGAVTSNGFFLSPLLKIYNVGNFIASLQATNLTADRTIEFPNAAGTIVLNDNAVKLSNKRNKRRVDSITSSSTPTGNKDNYDQLNVTALAATAVIQPPGGTPDDGDLFVYRIKDNAVARTISFAAGIRFSADLPAPTTTIVSKTLIIGLLYNAADTTWDAVTVINNF